MKTTQLVGQAVVSHAEPLGLHYVWEHDVEGDVIEGSFHFPVVMERGDRVTVDLEGERTTLTIQQVVYQPIEGSILLRLA